MAKLITDSIVHLFLFILPLTFISCKKTETDKIYRINGSITVDGRARTYLLNMPPEYYDTSNFSLVIAMHGTGGNAGQFERDYGITQKGNESKFIVVYPEGVQSTGILGIRTWNAGTCCNYAKDNNIDDVHFISVLIDELASKYKINPKKVYVTGISNGAMMAYRLACEIPDKIAAIAPVSGPMLTSQPCNPSRAVPILHIHSLRDTKVPYFGGIGIGGYYFPPVDSVLNFWASYNGCNAIPQIVVDNAEYRHTKWYDCSDGLTIESYLTQDGGHAWPGGLKSPRSGADTPSVAINATDVIWDFFQRYTLP